MYAMIGTITWKATGNSCSAVSHYNKKMIREEICGEFRGDLEEGMKKGATRSA